MNTTWFKFPTSYFGEARTLRLRRAIGESAYWVPVRLWAFAASQDGTGDLSGYEAAELAEALGYKGEPAELIAALTPDFLDRKRRVVGWDELFALAASRKRSSQKAARARWSQRDETREDQMRERRGDRDAMRDAMRDASDPTPTHTNASRFSLSETERSDVASEFDTTGEIVAQAERVFRENKANYPQDPQNLDAFKGWLRTSAAGKKLIGASREPRVTTINAGGIYSEPEDWKEAVAAVLPPGADLPDTWLDVPATVRSDAKAYRADPAAFERRRAF